MSILEETKHTLDEAAQLLGVTRRTVERYATRGARGVRLKLTRIGGKTWVLERHLVSFVEQQNQSERSPNGQKGIEIMQSPLEYVSEKMPALRDWKLTKTVDGQRFIWRIAAPAWKNIPVELTTDQTKSAKQAVREIFRQTGVPMPRLVKMVWLDKFARLRQQIEAKEHSK